MFKFPSKLPRQTGPWYVDVKRAGRYKITLRQYPEVAGKTVIAERARVVIAGKTVESKVQPDSKGVVFEMDLNAGKTQILTCIYNKAGKAGGACFTEVELLGTPSN
ncbi:hypothetical protein N9H09_00405 [bacterium]|nr:hypothetical protein [bacterium]